MQAIKVHIHIAKICKIFSLSFTALIVNKIGGINNKSIKTIDIVTNIIFPNRVNSVTNSGWPITGNVAEFNSLTNKVKMEKINPIYIIKNK